MGGHSTPMQMKMNLNLKKRGGLNEKRVQLIRRLGFVEKSQWDFKINEFIWRVNDFLGVGKEETRKELDALAVPMKLALGSHEGIREFNEKMKSPIDGGVEKKWRDLKRLKKK